MSLICPDVLIVDDEPDLCELLSDALAREGLHVRTAGSGAEALALAEAAEPDLLVADLCLPDGSGLDLIEQVRSRYASVPALLITGRGDLRSAGEACRRGCGDFLTKPLDLGALREAVRRGLASRRQLSPRETKLRDVARRLVRQRRELKNRVNTTCCNLTDAYRSLNTQFGRQEELLRFHRYLLACRDDDDVFRGLFEFFAERSGQLFGSAMVCNGDAQLELVGRFGSPQPDGVEFCRSLVGGVTEMLLDHPVVTSLAADDNAKLFPTELHPKLIGVNLLCVPLLPEVGQLIGMVVLYRKGEQPFTDTDVALAEMLAPAVAVTIRGTATT